MHTEKVPSLRTSYRIYRWLGYSKRSSIIQALLDTRLFIQVFG